MRDPRDASLSVVSADSRPPPFCRRALLPLAWLRVRRAPKRRPPWNGIFHGAWRVVDADGAIRFESLSVGSHELAVRGIGYRGARVNVHVSPDAGIQAVAMAGDPSRFDGGCGMMYRARKPWWKVW